MSIYDLSPTVINPILVSRLDGNVEAAILLSFFDSTINSNPKNNGWEHFAINQLCEITGLSENKVKLSIRTLKKINAIRTKRNCGAVFYNINSLKIQELVGYKINPSLLKKLGSNAKAVVLLSMFLEFNRENGIPLVAKLPSVEIKHLTGMKTNCQIYARDSLLGMKFLRIFDKDDSTFVLDESELVKSGIIKIINA